MAVLQCGACPRFISVSAIPGGNPVAKADPERWSATRTVCSACGKSLCDRCAPAGATRCAACGAALAQGAAAARPTPRPAARGADDADPEDADDLGVEWHEFVALRESRNWLLAASATALLTLLVGRFGMMSLVMWVAAIITGIKGMRLLLRADGRPEITGWLSGLVLLLPGINLLFVGFFLAQAHARVKQLERTMDTAELQREARRRALLRQVERKREASAPAAARAPAAAPPPAAVVDAPAPAGSRVRRAIAYVKLAGLGDQAEGARLQVRVRAQGADIPPDQLPVVRASKGTLGVMYAVDEGEGLAFVNGRELATEQLSLEDLHRLALHNLETLMDGGSGLRMQQHGEVHALLLDGNFEASLLLLDSLWDTSLRKFAPNGAVVAIPARDICAFCDARSADGIAQLQALAQRVTANGDHLITDKLFVRHAGRWRDYPPLRPELGPLPLRA